MAVKKKSEKRIKKEAYWKRLQVVAQKYNNVLFVDADNVSSKQIAKIRVELRKIDAYMIMGKNVSIVPPPYFRNRVYFNAIKMSRKIIHSVLNNCYELY